MTKKVDQNGYWYIKKNPISKEGVFPYLGHNISDECEPNKIYKVYRSAKTLQDSVPTWDNPPKPFIDDHEMLGEGFTAIDDRPVQGIIYNPVCENGTLYADIAVYSEDLKHNIENGKKELSLGYFCKYKKERGVFKGEVYDYVQTDMVGNHIALVDAGRCGSEVKVFDHKCTMDSMPVSGSFVENESTGLKKTAEIDTIKTTEQKESGMYITLEAVKTALNEAFTYGDGEVDPKVKLIIELLESKAKATTDEEVEKEKETEDSDEEKEEKAEDKCGKDSEEEKEDKKAEDALQNLMSIVKDMADDVKKLVAEKAEQEEKETEDEDEDKEKPSEDEDETETEEKEEVEVEDEDEEEVKKSEDSALFVFGKGSFVEDEALKEYLK